MRKFFRLFLTVVFLGVKCQEQEEVTEVEEVPWEYSTKQTFESSIDRPAVTFVIFGTEELCDKCRDLRETWNKLKEFQQEEEPDLVLLSMDCDGNANQGMCDGLGIKTYPTLIAFSYGAEVAKFDVESLGGDLDTNVEALKTAVRGYIRDFSLPPSVVSNGVMFYPKNGTFIIGDKLIDDFWTGSRYPGVDVELACREACVERLPAPGTTYGCYAYSVKVEEPMKGQCYLKAEPKIEFNNEYEYFKAPYYNSAEIGAQQFKDCWSNVYGKKSVHDPMMPKKLSGCWSHNRQANTCEIANTDCLDIQCTSNTMKGSIREDTFHDNLILDDDGNIARKVIFNGKNLNETLHPRCQQMIQFDQATRRFTFEIPLGACGMTSTHEHGGFIKFAQEISFKAPKRNTFGLLTAGAYTASVGFNCLFKTSTEGMSKFKVITRIMNGQIEQRRTWDFTSKLQFYNGPAFVNVVPSTTRRNIGFPVYFRSSWELNFIPEFPVKFYVRTCTVMGEGDETYEIVKDGCGSILADTQLYSRSVYQDSQSDFSFRSFSFKQGNNQYGLTLKCTLNFCLETDIEAGTCGIEWCPKGYRSLSIA